MIRKYILELTVFTCGALVMIFEIIGSRILSPYIGTSTYVWTSLIGIILGALSLGYWIGGRLADRSPDARVLGAVIFAAGGLISITTLIKEVFLSSIAAVPMGLEVKAVIAALALFAPASICLGIVTPFAVRLKMTTVDKTGRTVGRLYALSTIGSIAGTFAAGFLLIPFVGSVRTLYFISATLMVLALLVAPLAVKARNTTVVIVIFVLGIAASEGNMYLLRANSDLYDIDTEYSRVQVFLSRDPETGKPIRALATDPYFVQSAAFLDSDDLVLEYSRFYHLIRHFQPELEKTLIIGGAGYSFPKEHLRAYPAALDVVEIDPQMTEIARRFFGLQDDPRMNIIHEDARMYINRAESGQYDAILMDAFGSLFAVPHHLTTIEAVRELSRILKDDGVVIFNLGSAITGPSSGFLQAELRTYQQVFPQVYLFKVRPHYTDDHLQNLIIVASKDPSPAPLTSSDPQIADLLSHRYTTELQLTKSVLTDDLAPVEYYNSIAQNIYLKNRP